MNQEIKIPPKTLALLTSVTHKMFSCVLAGERDPYVAIRAMEDIVRDAKPRAIFSIVVEDTQSTPQGPLSSLKVERDSIYPQGRVPIAFVSLPELIFRKKQSLLQLRDGNLGFIDGLWLRMEINSLGIPLSERHAKALLSYRYFPNYLQGLIIYFLGTELKGADEKYWYCLLDISTPPVGIVRYNPTFFDSCQDSRNILFAYMPHDLAKS